MPIQLDVVFDLPRFASREDARRYVTKALAGYRRETKLIDPMHRFDPGTLMVRVVGLGLTKRQRKAAGLLDENELSRPERVAGRPMGS